ncbi:MAG: hypothetical protein QF436_02580 [Candidatus Woesearchaeota archaeon]|jgi:hypothetical protein|nr:hypothetical protein [Candidatus Woesearchaeota archaeon]MDP7622977.1 hypothetical protein [Candidatus Woesearchaeota archaeon]HJN56392.1 hypothetical protein [Candidatus Woesearchaeota archaeon]|tara:strand:+ start:18488 stop:19438 length:951 start_codon:yes stop_codon:yes gene_type:complete
MDANEKILLLVKEKGPVLPVQLSKEIDDNILMTSARLSELSSKKQIKISYVKIGGSPLYYFPGQEHMLQNFSENLHEKEKKAYEMLKQNKILRDSSQEPVIRVALREIKDFAVPLQVSYEHKNEIFWKWYLFDSKDAQSLIKEILSKKEDIKKPELPPKQAIPIQEKIEEQKKQPEQKPQEYKKPEIMQHDRPTEKLKEEIKKEPAKKTIKTDKNAFLNKIHNFLDKNKIKITEKYEVKKNSEMDFIVELETSIGNIKYFCKSKNKKKINDADLSTASIQAQSKNLPLLFLTNGTLTKKASTMLNNEFKNIKFKAI